MKALWAVPMLLAAGCGDDKPSGGPPPASPVSARGKTLPQGFMSYPPASGSGEVIVGHFGASSARDLLRAGFGQLSQFFDGAPRPVGAIGDKQDRTVQAQFVAQAGGELYEGFAVSVIDGNEGWLGFMVDRAGSLKDSYATLYKTFAGILPQKKDPSPREETVRWQNVPFPDNSGSMRLPDGWKINSASKGSVDASGPQGSIYFGFYVPIIHTPESAAQAFGTANYVAPYGDVTRSLVTLYPQIVRGLKQFYPSYPDMRFVRIIDSKPVQNPNGVCANVRYEVDIAGQGRFQTLAQITNNPLGDGTYLFYASMVSAPTDQFEKSFPVLLDIWKSYQVAGWVHTERLNNAAKSQREAFEIQQQSYRATQRVMDRAVDDFSEYIRGTNIVRDSRTDTIHEVSHDTSQKLVQRLNEYEGFERYQIIPLKDLNNPQ